VLLRILKPTLNLHFFPDSVCHQNLGFFEGVSDDFGSSVYKTIFTYQVAVFKRRCVTQWLPSLSYRRPSSSEKVGAGSGTMVIGVVGSGRHHTVNQLLARDLPNVHGARCIA